MKSLERVIVETFSCGPLNTAVARTKVNVHKYIGAVMLRRQRMIMWFMAALCLMQLGSIAFFVLMFTGKLR